MANEEDDLYADLYSEDVGTSGDKGGGGQVGNDSVYDDDVKPKGVSIKGTSNAASASSGKSSFIPAAQTSSQSSGSSFIPADTGRTATNSTSMGSNTNNSSSSSSTTANRGNSSIPSTTTPVSTYSAANTSRIETAPMTNAGSGSKSQSSYSTSNQGQSYSQLLPHEMPDEGKLFVGGLNWETTDEGLKQYFSQFGKVNYCLIMRDPSTQRSRGFAFLTFDDPKAVNSVMVKEHFLDGKIIDPKRAIPRQENIKTAKCFIGGIPQSATPETFKAFFEQYGNVLDSTLMMDRETQKPRGYGFVTYDNDATVEGLLSMDALVMDGKMIEVKRATPRNADGTKKTTGSRTDNVSSRGGDDDYSTSTSSTNGMDSSIFMQGGAAANPMAAAMMMRGNPMLGNNQQQSSFDPQMMALFFQQQNWGNANFSPMAFQQMMMGGMGMGSGMGGWGGNMSPWMGGGGNGMNMCGSMSPSGAGQSPNPSSGNNQNRGGSGKGTAAGIRSQNSPDGRGERAGPSGQSSRSRSNLQAPSSAGLPSRPSTGAEHSPNPGRDYSREKSPERGNSSNQRGGGYNRDNRW